MPVCLLHGYFSFTSIFLSSCFYSFTHPPPFLRLLLLSLSPFISRFSQWSLAAALPPSHVGWAERRRLVAPTAPRRERFMRSSACQSQSALWQVGRPTAAEIKLACLVLNGTKWPRLTCIESGFLKSVKMFLLVLSLILFSVLCVLCVLSVWKRLEVLPNKQRQENAHRLHQERSSLRHREVSGRYSLVFCHQFTDCVRDKEVSKWQL